jgi:DNA invertase Pin-like site-specific DNA recombinase
VDETAHVVDDCGQPHASYHIRCALAISDEVAYTDTDEGRNGMKIGYSRVSTKPQDLEAQRAALVELGVDPERIYLDHGFTGKNLQRDGLSQAFAAVRDGDVLVVPRLDRFARNAEDTLRLIRELTGRGVAFQMGHTVYDPQDPFSKLWLTFLAAVAEAEGGWISLRTQEAMARPNVRAKLKGRQSNFTPRQDAAMARHLAEGELSVVEIADLFHTSRASVYRAETRHRERSG